MKISAAIVLTLVADGNAFVAAPQKASSTRLNMAFGVGEALVATALSGVVGQMTKKREEIYASGKMAAVSDEPASNIPDAVDANVSIDMADISIPYDAPARLAYTMAGSNGDFEAFKVEYLKETVAMVTAKKVTREGGVAAPVATEKTVDIVDISIPYDAPARLAYTMAGSNGDFEAFKVEYLKETVAMVTAKKVAREGGVAAPVATEKTVDVVDISIPYDAPARLAYAMAGSNGDFEAFKVEYLKETVAMVTAKKFVREGGVTVPVATEKTVDVVDISIPYDAPARLAYTMAGSKGDFEAFKAEYLKETVAMVTAKRMALVSN